MFSLRQMFKNEFDKDKTLSKRVVENTSISQSNLSKFINDPERDINFSTMLEIVRFVFPDREYELMDKHLRTVDPNKKIARIGLEYSNVTRLDDLHTYLIDKLGNSTNGESKEWSQLYSLNKMAIKGKITRLELIDRVNELKIKAQEMKVYSKLLLLYSYYELDLIDILVQTSKLLAPVLSEVKEEYMKPSLTSRYALVMTAINLHLGKVDEVREYGDLALRHSEQNVIKCQLLLHIGNSYMMESYDKSIEHFNNALGLCTNEDKVAEIQSSINFVSNYWAKAPQYINIESEKVSDIHEVAFYYIRQGKIDEGMKLLEDIDFENLTNNQRAYNFFYRGLATSNKNYFYESVRYFNLAGEKYYKRLPIIELRKLGENEVILNALSV